MPLRMIYLFVQGCWCSADLGQMFKKKKKTETIIRQAIDLFYPCQHVVVFFIWIYETEHFNDWWRFKKPSTWSRLNYWTLSLCFVCICVLHENVPRYRQNERADRRLRSYLYPCLILSINEPSGWCTMLPTLTLHTSSFNYILILIKIQVTSAMYRPCSHKIHWNTKQRCVSC